MNDKYRNPQAEKIYRSIVQSPASFPFSFCYSGERIQGFPEDLFTMISRESEESDDRIVTHLSFSLDDTLQIAVRYTFYPLHGASDWVVTFSNPGKKDSGVISDALSVLTFSGERPLLKGILGDHVNLYRPYILDPASGPVHFSSDSGRPTHVNFPYFNLEYGSGGAMLAIGWAGTWQADFCFDAETEQTTYTARSVNTLCTYLKPGESIRTALFVLAPYTVRDEDFAVNYWRSWFIHSNLPKADAAGSQLKPFSSACLASDTGRPNTDGSISEDYTTWRPSLEKMLAEDVRVDFRWMDAGWYAAADGRPVDGSAHDNDWHSTIGTWTLDPVKWPGKTFLESTDFARAHGMKTLLWFEPERVCDVAALEKNYGYRPEWAIHGYVNNIGDPDCLAWTLGQITKTLRENLVEMYREDNNCDPAEIWRELDECEGEHRRGITESRLVDAHYRMWDEIIACTTSYGGCAFVDSCASGGGRNDLESLRRGVPLLRSDSDRTSAALRLSMTTSFNKWIPFCGSINKEKDAQLDAKGVVDDYVWRASYLPAVTVDSQYVQDPAQDFEVLRKGLKEWKRVSEYLLSDFYVHTPWHPQEEKDGFTAYSFFDDEKGEGVLLAFRQEDCGEPELTLTLPYIRDDKVFELRDEDSGEVLRITGKEMTEKGLILRFDHPRQARLLWVRKTY